MKVFLATPISTFREQDDFLKYRRSVVKLVSILRKEHSITCEIDEIGGKGSYDSPVESFTKDFSAIKSSDCFILHYPNPSPTSALIELGFAIALEKKVIIVTPDKQQLPYLVQSIEKVGTNYSVIENRSLGKTTTKRIIDILAEPL